MITSPSHARVARGLAGTVGCTALALAVTTGTGIAAAAPDHGRDIARQVLPAGDGWASHGTGTTGGAAATAEHVHTVTTWDEFRAALAESGDTPKIIKVRGTLDADGAGCADFAADGYDFDQYLADYDPDVWGRDTDLEGEKNTPGTQEYLRNLSAANQAEAVKADIPAHTTVIGVGRNPGIVGGSLRISGVDNVIVRGLTLESPLDCFPQWDPTDTADGNWNSEYDSAVVSGSTHVWMDHNTFTDGAHPDATLPTHFGRLYQRHDGELDIVKGSDHVTASWNVFADHDKTILIGNSDSESTAAVDRGHLKVTFHHNLFKNLVERAPRVRFGQVDSYNNHFVVDGDYSYSYGIGKESQLVAEHNAFSLPDGVSPAKVLKKWSEAPLTAAGNVVNGRTVDLIAAHNAEMPEEPLASGAGWTPVLRTHVDPARVVPRVVAEGAGAEQLR